MRDPARITRLLTVLETYWRLHPDLRLGQIVVNFQKHDGGNDPFYLEDDDLIVFIEEALEQEH